MTGTETPIAKRYLEQFESVKHKNYINLYDAQNACYIAAAEAQIQMADALNIQGEEIERVRKQLKEFGRIFNLNTTKTKR